MFGRLFSFWSVSVFVAILLFTMAASPPQAFSATILARQYVTNTVHIPGGAYAAPYVISTPNTEYILDGDITAAGTAIAIRASKVVLNLNGKSISYNQSSPGEGVTIDAYNINDIAIVNGSITQGAASSEGDVYGAGNNPIKSIGIERLQIAGISARYSGRDVGGFFIKYVTGSIIEENTLEDHWTQGTLKNRHQGVDAIKAIGGSNVIRNNTVLNARHRGVQIGNNDEVYGNSITINSLATNAYGIFAYAKQNVRIHNNTITARGEHPIGIGAVSSGTNHIEIFNNTIDVQTTRIGEEYGGNTACFNPATPCGNYAVGFRTTWGGNNISFHDNIITVHTDSAYQGSYSPTGQSVVVNGKGRGLMVAVNAGESSRFYNNTITTLDKDGTGKAFGIACTGGNVGEMIFEKNSITSNILNVALGDEYGACGGYPLFLSNTFVKADNYTVYATIGSELNGYWEGTGRFVSNNYQGGAAENRLKMNFQYPNKNKSVIFGRLMQGMARDAAGVPIANLGIATYNAANQKQTATTTAADGSAQVMVYDYELNNNNGLTQNATPISIAFRPHVVELFDPSNGQTLFRSQPDSSSSAWDALNSSGNYILGDSSRSLTLTSSPVTYTPPAMDTTAPIAVIGSPVGGSSLSGQVVVNVTATDDTVVSKVELYLDGALLATDPAPGPFGFTWNSAAVANGSHTLLAKAYDAAGNVGSSASLSVTVNNLTVDATPPAVNLTSPAANAIISGTVAVTATANDAGGIKQVEFYVDNVLQAALNSAPYSYSLNTTLLSNGPHTLMVKALDTAGNQAQASAAVQVNNGTGDTTAPVVSFSSPVQGAVLKGAVTLAVAATDNVGVKKVELYFNSTLLTTFTTAPYSFVWNTVPYYNYPSCTITAKAYDAAGNVKTTSITVSIANDKTSPAITVTSPVDNGTVAGSVAVAATASDDTGVSKVEFYVNGALQATDTTAPYNFAWNSLAFANGTYAVSAKAYDAAGNVGQSAPVTVTVNNPVKDTIAPVVSAFSSVNVRFSPGVVLTATSTDNVGVVKMTVTAGDRLIASANAAKISWTFADLAPGKYTVVIRAYDAAGNVGSKTATVWR